MFHAEGAEYQLITWSKDRTLRFWPMDSETMEASISSTPFNRRCLPVPESENGIHPRIFQSARSITLLLRFWKITSVFPTRPGRIRLRSSSICPNWFAKHISRGACRSGTHTWGKETRGPRAATSSWECCERQGNIVV